MTNAIAKYLISFQISKDEYDYYLAGNLSHHDYYKKGQETHKEEKDKAKV